ncbi:MAG: DEAD/DEAH box helicase [Bdellovibrionales bacterium]|nr:DEAD/DEAH box helicase [Bdellovibrionales bacterium]
MSLPPIETVFEAVQAACSPGIWSRGVSLSRDVRPLLETEAGGELRLRVPVKDRPVTPRVTLWTQDGDWHCDCGSREDPCAHVAAAVIALKAGRVDTGSGSAEASEGAPGPAASASGSYAVARVEYAFSQSRDGALQLQRFVARGGEREPLGGTLTSLVGGRLSGRLNGVRLAAEQSDFAAEHALGAWGKRPGIAAPESSALSTVLRALEDCTAVFFEDRPVKTSGKLVAPRAAIADEGLGIRVKALRDPSIERRFRNGAVLRSGVLQPASSGGLADDERRLLEGEGTWIAPERLADFMSRVLPKLEAKIPVEITATRLPRTLATRPRVLLHLESVDEDVLVVTPRLVYGSPPVARVTVRGELEQLFSGAAALRDKTAEQLELRKLQNELQLSLDQPRTFHGAEAAAWVDRHRVGWDLSGSGYERFAPSGELRPHIEALEKQARGDAWEELELSFELDATPGGNTAPGRADAGQALAAWRRGEDRVPLLGGGWARLPADWMERFAERAAELLERRALSGAGSGSAGSKPGALRTRLGALERVLAAELLSDTGSALPRALQAMRGTLDQFEGLPEAPLPRDLVADLRPYQRLGVNWLSYLRDQSLGAVLADDMGLGKTLQALCAARGRTLVVAPTSVLASWADQIRRFRPRTTVALFHGASRSLPEIGANDEIFVVTSHALARLELGALSSREWDTLILDEAQAIKNPESQTSQAVFRLPGKFKIALSGTPVENRLEDLWSVFRFAVPGLLGELPEFRERVVKPISGGDSSAAKRLRSRIKPLLLRRTKREVAKDLPARTETLLPVELGAPERQAYDTLLAATRSEVLARLGDPTDRQGMFAALEWLLRLRQACCDPRLLPEEWRPRTDNGPSANEEREEGAPTGTVAGAKIQLLAQTLETSLADGHRALVFSQWTSFLDLISATLNARGISHSRLDGSTAAPERARIVTEYQSDGGPPVLLLSLKAGGVGLTLTAADHVFLMDPWWNPAAEDQAADRAHRIGQVRAVLIHRLVAAGTVEERILALQGKKRELMRAALEDGGAASGLTREDLMELLR